MMMKKRGRSLGPSLFSLCCWACSQVIYLIKHRWLWKWERCPECGTFTHHQYQKGEERDWGRDQRDSAQAGARQCESWWTNCNLQQMILTLCFPSVHLQWIECSIPIIYFQLIDDPFLRSEQRSCPVQLPLAVSGWGFKEEFSTPVKVEKVEEQDEAMESGVEGNGKT